MNAAEYLKSIAGRWDRRKRASLVRQYDMAVTFEPFTAQPDLYDPASDEDGTGIWLPAGVVRLGDEVNVRGHWHRVTAVESYRGVDENGHTSGRAHIYLAGRSWLQCGYASKVYVRDVAAIIGDEFKGVSM